MCRKNVLVEENPGPHDEFEDVIQSLQSFQQLLRKLLRIIHIVLQDFCQLSEKNIHTHTVLQIKTKHTITQRQQHESIALVPTHV